MIKDTSYSVTGGNNTHYGSRLMSNPRLSKALYYVLFPFSNQINTGIVVSFQDSRISGCLKRSVFSVLACAGELLVVIGI
jgi:hypothetical protein